MNFIKKDVLNIMILKEMKQNQNPPPQMLTRLISFLILLLLCPMLNMSCQNKKNMKQEQKKSKEFLIHLLKEEENHGKYLFADGYVPSIMIRKGFDYVDSYLTSPASDDFFVFDKQAIDYKKSEPLWKSKETLFCSLYINNKGQIAEVTKRKMRVSSVDSDSLEFDQEDIPEGISRFYRNQILTDTKEFLLNIISTNEFDYFYIEKDESNIDVYRVEIINNYSRDVTISNVSDNKGKFCVQAELIYNEKGEFLDIKVTDDAANSNQTNHSTTSLENENEEEDLPEI